MPLADSRRRTPRAGFRSQPRRHCFRAPSQSSRRPLLCARRPHYPIVANLRESWRAWFRSSPLVDNHGNESTLDACSRPQPCVAHSYRADLETSAALRLFALAIHVTDCIDDEVRLVEWDVFRALVSEQLLGIRRDQEPLSLRSCDFVLVGLPVCILGTPRIEAVDSMVAGGQHPYRARAERETVLLEIGLIRGHLLHF